MRDVAKAAAALVLVAMLVPIPLVSAESVTGSRITFADIPSGTTASIAGLDLRGNSATDVVVLESALWVMYRASDNSQIFRYHPDFAAGSWNISFEAYAPRTGNSYAGQEIGKYGLQAFVSEGSSRLGIELCVGNSSVEGIYLIQGEQTTLLRQGILPAYPNGNTSDGERPDRYIVSFQRSEDGVRILISTSTGSRLASSNIPWTAALAPSLSFYSDSVVKSRGGNRDWSINGGWMVDDLTVRAPRTAYPVLPQLWATSDRNSAVSVALQDEAGTPLEATVDVAGHQAAKIGANYLVYYPREVNWCLPTAIDVDLGYMHFRDRILLTTTSSVPGASVAEWWGGYDWASVLGTDDCAGFSTVAAQYQGIDHPLTAYVMTISGSSNEILATQSELGMHLPHDYYAWKRASWSDAVSLAGQTHSQMQSAYTFASRWDDPSYVGRGDTYLSMANPGSAASYEMMFAQFLAGTRIEGGSSNQADSVAGNYSIFGSWQVHTDPWWDQTVNSWQPARAIDLMDAQRQVSTDYPHAEWGTVKYIAANGGLLRLYNHQFNGNLAGEQRDLVQWIANPKSNYPYENWKATDGEVASYVYARHTTALSANSSLEFGYDVKRLDPRDAGYWLVPVTVSIDLGGRQVRSVSVVEHTPSGDKVQTLEALNGQRVMDIGYDIRNGKLEVSAFYNASATIVIDAVSSDPHIKNYPPSSVYSGEGFSFLASSTLSPSGRPLVWSFDNSSAPWLQGEVVSDHSFRISGMAVAGTFHLILQVGDGFRNDSINWTLSASPRKTLTITSLPMTVGAAGLYYEYQAVCPGATAWRLEGQASWLTVDGHGRVRGYPPADLSGKDLNVRLIASSGQISTSQNFTLHVNASPADNPKVTLPFIGIVMIMALLLVLALSYAFGKD